MSPTRAHPPPPPGCTRQYIINHLVVATSSEKDRPLHLVENVSKNLCPAHTVIHINPHRIHSHPASVMDEITANAIATVSVVSAAIDRSHIPGFERDMVNLIKLNKVIVSREQYGAMRMVLD